MAPPRILYCHCAHARVVPPRVKNEVLDRLAAAGVPVEAVADLCEMSARRDPALQALAEGEGELRIAACFPRSVRWLFAAAGAPLPEGDGAGDGDGGTDSRVRIANMREESAVEVADALLEGVERPAAGAALTSDSAPNEKS